MLAMLSSWNGVMSFSILLPWGFSKWMYIIYQQKNTVSPLHTTFKLRTFEDVNVRSYVQSRKLVHVSGIRCHVQLALCLLLLTILQLYHLPPPLPPPVSNSSCLFTRCQPLYASCCTVLLYFSGYCTVRLKMFSLFFVFVFYVSFVWKVL